MSSYKKFVMMGATTILIPLGKVVIQKLMRKFTEKSEEDFVSEEDGEFTTNRRQFARRAE